MKKIPLNVNNVVSYLIHLMFQNNFNKFIVEKKINNNKNKSPNCYFLLKHLSKQYMICK